MNSSQQQIHTCKSHNIKQVWNTYSVISQRHHIITIKQFAAANTTSCDNFSNESKLHYYKKAIYSCFY